MRKKKPSVLHQPAYLLGYAYGTNSWLFKDDVSASSFTTGGDVSPRVLTDQSCTGSELSPWLYSQPPSCRDGLSTLPEPPDNPSATQAFFMVHAF
jgi:hypothetical protein